MRTTPPSEVIIIATRRTSRTKYSHASKSRLLSVYLFVKRRLSDAYNDDVIMFRQTERLYDNGYNNNTVDDGRR